MDFVEGIGGRLSVFPMGGGTLTAAGTGDNTEVTPSSGANIHPAGKRNDHPSGKLVIAGRSSVANAQTLKFTVKESESDDGSSWGSDTTIANAVTVVTGVTSAADFKYAIDVNLKGKKAYVRYKITPDLSAGATDTAQWGAALVCVDTETPAE